MTKLIIFDYAGTLVDCQFNDYTYLRALELIYLKYEKIQKKFPSLDLFFDYMKNLWMEHDKYCNKEGIEMATFDLLNNFFFNNFNFKDKEIYDIIEILSEHDHDSTLFEGVEITLNKLKSNGYTLALFSNNILDFPRRELDRFGLTKYFDYIKVSAEFGYRKPNVNVFEEIVSFFNLEKNQVISIGDNYKNDILTPKSLGILKTVHLTDNFQNSCSEIKVFEFKDIFEKLVEKKWIKLKKEVICGSSNNKVMSEDFINK